MRDHRLAEIESLYRQRFTHFLRVATAITADQDSALDAVQEAFAAVVKNRRSFRSEGPLEAWVWRAVVNAARRTTRSGDAPVAAPTAAADDGRPPGGGSEVARAIALLPERQRLAVFLRYYADLDYRSIAAALEIEVGTVSATLSAAHSSVRRALRQVPR